MYPQALFKADIVGNLQSSNFETVWGGVRTLDVFLQNGNAVNPWNIRLIKINQICLYQIIIIYRNINLHEFRVPQAIREVVEASHNVLLYLDITLVVTPKPLLSEFQ